MAIAPMPTQQASTAKKEPTAKITGSVTVQPKSKTDNILGQFFAESLPSIKNYFLNEWLIPTLKNAVFGGLMSTLDMALFGGKGNSFFPNSYANPSYRPYTPPPYMNHPYGGGVYGGYQVPPITTPYSNAYGAQNSYQRSTVYDYNNLVFTNRQDAENVLRALNEKLIDARVVNVADFYREARVPTNFTDENYGWYDLRSATITASAGGWVINLPKAYAVSI